MDANATSPSAAIGLKALLTRLPQTDLVIFHSFFLDGKKAADIGKQLGISPAQVYRRLSDIRNMLVRHIR